MIRIFSTLLLIGCAEELNELSDGALPPPGNTPALVASELNPGAPARLSWGGLPPGARATFAASPRGLGAGPCPPVLGGACLEILNPIIVGNATANADGYAELRLNLPVNMRPGTYTFQGVATAPGIALLSNTFERATGPTFCPFNFDPVCGYDGVDYSNECMALAMGVSIAAWGSCVP